MKKTLNSLAIKAITWWNSMVNDRSGSDTTEKVGMVVAAVVIVGLLIALAKVAMPKIFNSIFGTAQAKLEGMF